MPIDRDTIGRLWGRNIADRLALLGMTYEDLAQRIGRDKGNVSRYISGDVIPPPDVLVLLCIALEITDGDGRDMFPLPLGES
jgi:transcriptional regulator with XRE-family HTH domain